MEINYTVVYSKRKTIGIEVTRDTRVIVRAPIRCPKSRIEQAVAHHEKWIERAVAKQKTRSAIRPEPTEDEIKALIEKARELLPVRTAHYSAIMCLRPQNVKISNARTRFGSCSYKNSINFSWRLMLYPPEAVDYVVVHELAHIRHKNHGKEFYALVESVLPDYKERRKMLTR